MPAIPIETIFNANMILIMGILYVIIYSLFGLFDKRTNIRLIIGFVYIGFLILVFSVGHSIFTLFLPMNGFGVLYINIVIKGSSISASLNIVWIILIVLGLKMLNLIRNRFKPLKIKKKSKRDELYILTEKKSPQMPF